MSHSRLQLAVTAGWICTVGAALAVRLSLGGAGWSFTEGVAWVLAGTLPVFVLRTVFTTPAGSIGQVLYDAEHAADAGRPTGAARKDADAQRGR